MLIRNQRAFTAGALFIALSIFYFVGSFEYAQGTAARMGPGFFPKMVSLLMAAIGLMIVVGALLPKARVEKLERWDFKGLLWITGAVVLFGILLQPLGLVISLCVLIIVASLASPDFRWFGTLVNTAFLVIFCVGVFVYGIKLQFPLWPALLR